MPNETLIDKLNYIKDQKDDYIIPTNIRNGVTVLNVTGTLQEGMMTPVEYNEALVTTQEILGSLPYTELEYIQSNGTEWINTEQVFKNNYKIEIKFQFYNSQDLSGEPFGTRTYNGTSTENNIFLSTYQNCWFAWGNSETALATTNISTNIWELVVDKNRWYLNNTLKLTANNTTFTSEVMYLFAEHYVRTDTSQDFVSYKSKTKIWYFRLYDNNNDLLLDLIPVQRISDNEICMYDKVTNQFFTNQGTGNFIAGPEKV